MRFLLFGAGALGSVVAARLAEVHEVALVGRCAHVEAIRENGLEISGHTEIVQRKLTAAVDAADVFDGDEIQPYRPDAVLLTVKAYDTEAAVEALAGRAGDAVFVSLQNGLGNEEIIAAGVPKVLGAVINQGATFLGPGRVFHAGSGEVSIGPFAGTDAGDAEAVAGALADAGFPARAVADVRQRIWGKAILNAAVNPLSGLLRKKTGELIASDDLVAAMRQVVDESVAIAAACGIGLDAAAIMDNIHAVAEATRDNKSSMFQDLEMGRRTEIEAINGAIVARAREHGVPCPINELLVNVVRAAQDQGV